MKILIATGIYPPDVGGPAEYAFHLYDEFKRLSHKVKIVSYGLEKKLPFGFRQVWYLTRILARAFSTNLIIVFDTMSTGVPAVIASFLLNKKVIVRIGGDFLWESFVERTGLLIPLPEFYKIGLKLSLKERIVRRLQQFVLDYSDAVVFSTAWQKSIWGCFYNINSEKVFIIENYFGSAIFGVKPKTKNFLWAGRPIKLKNINVLRRTFEEINAADSSISLETPDCSRAELLEKMRNCYAVVLPSVSEVSPNFIIEGLSFGKPFILTRDTGFFEKLQGLGVFINPLDIEDIKNAVLYMSDDKNYAEFLNGIKKFNFVHGWEEIAKEFLSIKLS